MATRKELLSLRNSKKPRGTSVYKRDVPNSGAYLKPVQDKGAGTEHEVVANFLKNMGTGVEIIGDYKKKEAKEERKKGIAAFTNATKEQKDKWANAIKYGLVNEAESPYFREGVDVAYAKTLLEKYNTEMFRQYEQDEGQVDDNGEVTRASIKNDKNSGALNDWLAAFDESFRQELGSLNPEVVATDFAPGQLGIRRQITQRHYEHLNANYRYDSYLTKQGEIRTFLDNHAAQGVFESFVEGEDIFTMLDNQRQTWENDALVLDKLSVILEKHGKEKTITPKLRTDLENLGEYGRGILAKLEGVKKAPKVAVAEENTQESQVVVSPSEPRADNTVSQPTVAINPGDTLIGIHQKLKSKLPYEAWYEQVKLLNSSIKHKIGGVGEEFSLFDWKESGYKPEDIPKYGILVIPTEQI